MLLSLWVPCRLAAGSRGLIGLKFNPFGNTVSDVMFFHQKTHDYLIFSLFMISRAGDAQDLNPFIYQRFQTVIFFIVFSCQLEQFYKGTNPFVYYLVSQLMQNRQDKCLILSFCLSSSQGSELSSFSPSEGDQLVFFFFYYYYKLINLNLFDAFQLFNFY